MGRLPALFEERILGAVRALVGLRGGSASASSASTGREREEFIQRILSDALPPRVRFGEGDIVDGDGRSSGQIDVVVEGLGLFAARFFGGAGAYFAEGVAAAIEVKSDAQKKLAEIQAKALLVSQLSRWTPTDYETKRWNEALERERSFGRALEGIAAELEQLAVTLGSDTTALAAVKKEIKSLRKGQPWGYVNFGDGYSEAHRQIPFFVVDYRGAARPDTTLRLLSSSPIDGLLQLDPLRYTFLPEGPATRSLRRQEGTDYMDIHPRHVDGAAAVVRFLEHLGCCIAASATGFKASWVYLDR